MESDNWRIKNPSSFSYVRAKPLNLKCRRSPGTITARAIQRTRTMVLTSPSDTYRYSVKNPWQGKQDERQDMIMDNKNEPIEACRTFRGISRSGFGLFSGFE